jgi:hypothetical protein
MESEEAHVELAPIIVAIVDACLSNCAAPVAP